MTFVHACIARPRLVSLSTLALLGFLALGCGEEKASTGSVEPTPVLNQSVDNQMEFMKKQQSGQP